MPADPNHLRFAQPRAMSRKVSDEFTVPVCRLHHRELHRHGDEKVWWQTLNIDPLPTALGLWKQRPTTENVILPPLTPQLPQKLGNVSPDNRGVVSDNIITTSANGGTRP
jgi:hypothetical protein